MAVLQREKPELYEEEGDYRGHRRRWAQTAVQEEQGQVCPAEITEAERKLQEVLCKWSLRERVAP